MVDDESAILMRQRVVYRARGGMKMFTYKMEIHGKEALASDKAMGLARLLPLYVIYDERGKLHTVCPSGWSEQQVVQEVDRLNADERTAQNTGGPPYDADTEGDHD